jgi:hypothetical protein
LVSYYFYDPSERVRRRLVQEFRARANSHLRETPKRQPTSAFVHEYLEYNRSHRPIMWPQYLEYIRSIGRNV